MMSKPQPGEIWLVRFPFSDLTSAKLRPALILAIHREEVIIVGIFSKIPTGDLQNILGTVTTCAFAPRIII